MTTAAPTTYTIPEGLSVYIVQAGDTISSIARSAGISAITLLALNPGISPKTLQEGTALYVPQTMEGACPLGNLYLIQEGDTYQSIASFSGLTIDEILAVNPSVARTGLLPGHYLCLPPATQAPTPAPLPETMPEVVVETPVVPEETSAAEESQTPTRNFTCPYPTPTCTAGRLYRIERGDILYDIARHSGVSLDALLAANPGIDPLNLQVGSYICVPPVAMIQ